MTKDTHPQQQTPQQTSHISSVSSTESTTTRLAETEQPARSTNPRLVIAPNPPIMHVNTSHPANAPRPLPQAYARTPYGAELLGDRLFRTRKSLEQQERIPTSTVVNTLAHEASSSSNLAQQSFEQSWKFFTAAGQADAHVAPPVSDVGIEEIVAFLSPRYRAGINEKTASSSLFLPRTRESLTQARNVMPPAAPVSSSADLGTTTQVQAPNTLKTTGNTVNEANLVKGKDKIKPGQQSQQGRQHKALREQESSERRKVEREFSSTFARLHQEFDAPLSSQREYARLALAAQYVEAAAPTTTPNDAASSSTHLLPPTSSRDPWLEKPVSGRSASVPLQQKQATPTSGHAPRGRSLSL